MWHARRRDRDGRVPEVLENGVTGSIVDDAAAFPGALERASGLAPADCRRVVAFPADEVSVLTNGVTAVACWSLAAGRRTTGRVVPDCWLRSTGPWRRAVTHTADPD